MSQTNKDVFQKLEAQRIGLEKVNSNVSSELKQIPLANLVKRADNARKTVPQEDFNAMVITTREVGRVYKPLEVRPHPDKAGDYEITDGHVRFDVAVECEFESVECIVNYEWDKQDVKINEMLSFISKTDLNPLDRAEMVDNYINDYLQGNRQTFCQRFGRTESWLTRTLAPLKLDADLLEIVKNDKVRDYNTITKLKKLTGKDRKTAIEKINAGTFNADKDLLTKNPKKNKAQTAAQANNDAQAVFSFDHDQLKQLFVVTGWKSLEAVTQLDINDLTNEYAEFTQWLLTQ